MAEWAHAMLGVPLFPTNIKPDPSIMQYGVTPDGLRLLGLDRAGGRTDTFKVLLHWLTPDNPSLR